MNTRRPVLFFTRIGLFVWLFAPWLCAIHTFADSLEAGFAKPPLEARPWVYWFWLNSNISSNGITADLEAMKRVGIGGVLIMEVDQGAPVGPADFMGASWRDLFKHVVKEARRLGLEVNMNDDAGWNGSGGPWIRPEQSMQKVVWSETNVTGPKRFEEKLAQPETVAGFYRDIAAFAFPTPGAYRIERIKAKALYETAYVGPAPQTNLPAEMVIDRHRVIDISQHLDSNGQLAWDVPEGQWTIMRFGHTSTGAENAPAPKSGRGLECDKLSKVGIEANFDGMMAKLTQDNSIKPGSAKGLVATHIDSWENGAQNWTADLRREFRQRRGYDLFPFLPVMSGRVIDSLEVSERFLWDLRQTVSELVIENYAGHMRNLAHAHGLRFTAEAYGSPCDAVPYGGQADEPMGEFWTPGGGALETCKGMAGSGHLYGKRIIGAEAFTSGDHEKWREHPATIKALGDQAFCEGINRFVFHRYALQPWAEDRRPGMMMGPWGQHYERTETWWEQSAAWHQYLARCQLLLRQGLFVADICYLQSETPPHGFDAHPRHGYDWDECGADAVLTRMSVKDGRIVLPDGMSYRVLVLPGTPAMTPGLLRKISDLVQQGATVIGAPPQKSPSLTGFPQCDQEVKKLASDLWGDCDGHQIKEHRFGQGRVVWTAEPETVLKASGIAPDFAAQGLRHIHRLAGDTDIYFVSNPSERNLSAAATFRVRGKLPELWWPDTGRMEPAALWQETGGLTSTMLPLGPSGSVFVVFRQKAAKHDSLVSVARNGKTCLSAVETRLPLVVKRATYGVLNDPQRSRDVRAKVQSKVDSGQYSFPVRTLAEDNDPAPDTVKTLVVDYVIDGKQFSLKAQDSATVHLSPDAVNITVESARYGVLDDPKRTRDVRQKLQRLLDAGESSFQVARMAEGDDPAFMVVKTLKAEYTINGERRTVTGTDPDAIDLRPKAAAHFERSVELHRTSRGRLLVEAFQAGQYELVTAKGNRRRVEAATVPQPLEISGPWRVCFATNCGAPEQTSLEKLASWSAQTDPGIKYFSGTATYTKTINVPRELLARDRRLYLDLGRVEIMAEVRLNGKNLGILWKPPFQLDITEIAKPGENQLEVKVVNLWPNRLIGDEQLPEDSDRNPDGTLKKWPQWLLDGKPSPTGRHTFVSWRLWKKNDALLDSGLLGPVRLQPAVAISLPSAL